MTDTFTTTVLSAGAPALADELAPFINGRQWPLGTDPSTVTLFTQRDAVHEALKHLISKAKTSVVLTMFGYDDDELDQLIRMKLDSEHIFVQLSLDRSQAGGKHERDILSKWSAADSSNSVAVGTAASGAIAHMKSGIIDGVDVFDGSTNWSMSGEGATKPQNNSLVVIRNHAAAVRYRTQLDIDHNVMLKQMAKRRGTAT